MNLHEPVTPSALANMWFFLGVDLEMGTEGVMGFGWVSVYGAEQN